MGFPGDSVGKESASSVGDCLQEARQVPSVPQEIPWSRKWRSTPVFLLGKSHGQRSLVGYRLWGQRRRRDLETEPQVIALWSIYVVIQASKSHFQRIRSLRRSAYSTVSEKQIKTERYAHIYLHFILF